MESSAKKQNKTSATLLQRLRESDADRAWSEFVSGYTPLIVRYARRCGLRTDDVDDCLQQSLVTLLRVIPDFHYDAQRGKFRSYVFNIVRHQALHMMRRHERQGVVNPSCDIAEIHQAASEEEGGITWQQALLDEAWARLRKSGRLDASTAGAFEAYAINDGDAGDVARHHDIKPNTLYQIRSRVIAMLKDEVSAIEEQMHHVVWK